MNWLRKLMYGRYGGIDSLNGFFFICMVLMWLASILVRFIGQFDVSRTTQILYIIFTSLQALFILLFLLRSFSRNIPRRQAENRKFLELIAPLRDWKRFSQMKKAERANGKALYKCKKCKKAIRVPLGRGRIEITCPNCKYKFIRRT